MYFLVSISLLIIATACTSPSEGSPAETLPLAVSQTACETASLPPTPDLQTPSRPAVLLGGGSFTEDQFFFDLWLYCDSDLSPDGSGMQLSEVAGLGIHLAWRYNGLETSGPTKSFMGFSDNNDEHQPQVVWEGGLTPGTSGTFTGGVRSLDSDLTVAARSGTPIVFKIIVTVQDKTYGATITFTMVPASDGYRPTEIAIETLHQ